MLRKLKENDIIGIYIYITDIKLKENDIIGIYIYMEYF